MKKHIWGVTIMACAAMALTACSSGSGTASTTAAATQAAATEAAGTETEAAASSSGNAGIKLTWSEVNGEDYGGTIGAKKFKEKIEELSGGDITVEIYLNGTLGGEKECMQGIQMGTLDIFRGNASSLSNYGADKISLSGLPFLFKDMEQFQEMAVSPVGQELLDSVAEANCGYVALGWMTEGPRHMFITESTYQKLGKPSDFSLDMMDGLKIRVPETDLMVNTMTALKASATPIAYSELYTSLQSGVVDGAENDIINYFANSFNEVAPYFIPDAHTFGCGVILMSQSTWESLSEEQQGWMKEAAAAAGEAAYTYNLEKVQAAFDSFEEKGVTRLDVADLDKWSEACQSVYSTYDEESQQMIEKLLSGKYE
ncbi:TRAP transporter substrate-binding protein [Lacrimispora sp. 210928-DFI.3.58]|uniref:TRAP transporter substrate-binding protein n=1 Tax=Lacrimispora sp. 210928-DFI.3.58 TaxID=2883214 RepID=UPI001D097F2D|nr:TRAP transporter substrate-binding protein [Lacrimispora sp. 210928-DFI.3.58]MCB7321007.1 TRAP transporter substrate-binding protein [Lacrimispora sp. 210928-DFI.3.58]